MRFSNNNSVTVILGIFLAVSAFAILISYARGYNFIPHSGVDGFSNQIDYINSLLEGGQLLPFFENTLNIVHFFRFAVVFPYLWSERVFGSAGSMTLLQLTLWPLLFMFPPRRKGWLLGLRLILLILPLAVSGRTVLVVAGMGYLVSGIMKRPFSGRSMLAGCAFAALSSASVMFSIAILMFSGNWKGRTRVYYAMKALCIVILLSLFLPSLLAKAEGFSSGAKGYAYRVDDEIGTGRIAAVQRIILRSTVIESYRHGNYPRFILYIILFLAAWTNILWSAASRHWHPLLIVIGILSAGIFLEGLALWPVLLPIVWAYTGTFSRPYSSVGFRD